MSAGLKAAILQAMSNASAWLILAHEKPDGDTLGCTAALASLGARLGKCVLWAGRDAMPAHYAFLNEGLDYQCRDVVPWDYLGGNAAVICADISTLDRAIDGLVNRPDHIEIINIDHHADNQRFGTMNWIDSSASATGEMITELLDESPWDIAPAEANALYAAIVADSGGFKYSSTSIRSHEAAITLLEAGASPSEVARKLEQTLSVEILHLWGRAFASIRQYMDGRAAIASLGKNDFEETHTNASATENLVNFLLRIVGIEIAALCSENAGTVRVSLRAHPPCNARDVAAAFGGGGHDLAAGCRIDGALGDAIEKLRAEMERHIAARISDSR